MNKEFNDLKDEITKYPVLTYFDPQKRLTLTVDASKYAVGAAILHEKNPIAYASASLTVAHTNYTQIEKELFAKLFGCTRFHQYTYGTKVYVETDHKPLVSIFNKPLYKIPPRLQRFMLRLQSYNLNVSYKPGKYLYIADTLSRCSLGKKTLTELDEELELHCNFVRSYMEIPFSNVEEIKEYVDKDPVFLKIKNYVPYFKIKDEITILNDLLLKSNQI